MTIENNDISAYDYVIHGKEVPPEVHSQTLARINRVQKSGVSPEAVEEGLKYWFPEIMEDRKKWLK